MQKILYLLVAADLKGVLPSFSDFPEPDASLALVRKTFLAFSHCSIVFIGSFSDSRVKTSSVLYPAVGFQKKIISQTGENIVDSRKTHAKHNYFDPLRQVRFL